MGDGAWTAAGTDDSLAELKVADPAAFIAKLFRERGDAAYIGEPVSQTEHALQSAWLAEQAGASAELVTAALVHDIGHLLHNLPEDCADEGIDDRHEALGYRWLAKHFPPEVSEPVRLHVAAKRYLCATRPDYLARLSSASVLSLKLQGGPLPPVEAAEFEANPHYEAAVAVRLWDDEAKIEKLKTPPMEHFLPQVAKAAGGN